MNTKYTKEILENAVKETLSIRSTLIALGLTPSGGNYRRIKKLIVYYGIDISYFKGQGIHKETSLGPKLSKEEFIKLHLTQESLIKSSKVREKIVYYGLKENICEKCHKTKWLHYCIPLELHHKNGNNIDNRLCNLQILCPNCHTIMHMLDRKTKKRKRKNKYTCRMRKSKNTFTKICLVCDNTFKTQNKKSKYCSTECAKESREKIDWPTKEKLEKLVWEMSTVQLAKKLGVSDKAVEKRCKKYGIQKPPRGYWNKKRAGKI